MYDLYMYVSCLSLTHTHTQTRIMENSFNHVHSLNTM